MPKKYLTNNEEEDQDFYEYQQSIAAYNATSTKKSTLSGRGAPKYERGSLMQRLVDPFAGAPRDEDGAIVYTVTDSELADKKLDDPDYMKALYQEFTSKAEVWDIDAEDEDAWRIGLMEELESYNTQFNIDDFHAVLDKELAVFQKGEKYDFVKDLKDAYKDSLKTTSEQRIFDTIPDHVFWDIKKPQQLSLIHI